MRRVESVRASDVERKRVQWALAWRVAYGYLTLLIGEAGLGKSTWLSWVAAENSRNGNVTLVCSAEDGWDTTIRPRLEAWDADLRLVRFVEITLEDGSADGLLLPDDVDELSREIHDTGANIVTIDPISAHLGRDIDSHRDASTRQALAPLARLASEHNAAIIGAHHLNKSTSTDALSRASASVAFTAQARSVLLRARDPDDSEGERGTERALAHVKTNLSPLAPTQTWTVEPILLPAVGSSPEVETSRVRHTGESEHTGRDLLTRHIDSEPSAMGEAKNFLLAEIGTGPAPAKKVLVEARTLGISEVTLRRAAKDIGAETRKAGFAGGWEWYIPLSHEADHGPGSSSQDATDNHLRKNGSPVRVCAPPETPKNAEDDHQREMGIFDAERVRRFDEMYPRKAPPTPSENTNGEVPEDEVERLAELARVMLEDRR